VDEVPAGDTLGHRADNDCSWLGELLQPCCHVHGVSHRQWVTPVAHSHLAHDHDTRVDADPGVEAHFAALGSRRRELLDGADEAETRANGMDGVVALRADT
jgi:hypothetical protein